MDLLSGYASSSSEGGDNRESPAPTSSTQQPLPTVRRPPVGALDPAPRPSVPAAVLRSKGWLVPPPSSGGGPSSSSRALVIGGGGGGGTVSVRGSSSSSLVLTNNPLAATFLAPTQGPALLCDPSDGAALFLRAVDPKTGSTSRITADAAVDPVSFARNRTAFQRGEGAAGKERGGGTGGAVYGLENEVALAPGQDGREIRRDDYGHKRYFPPNHGGEAAVGGDAENEDEDDEKDEFGRKRDRDDDVDTSKLSRRARRRRQNDKESGPLVRDDDDEITHGIWAPPSRAEQNRKGDALTALERGEDLPEQIVAERAHLAERNRRRGDGEDGEGGPGEKEKFDRLVERKMSHLLPPRLEGEDPEAMQARTKFHGGEETDYRGRSWTDPPPGVRGADFGDVEDHACYVPKKCVHRFTGHSKGVHRIRLSPRTGHLLLSGGLDGKCKVWSVAQKKVMRTYEGHSAAVRDVQFNNDGSKFVSCSFDRFLRLWDVESGKVLGTYTNRRVPYVVKFYPKDDNFFVVGCSDNKLVTYDATTGEITQEYDHHLAPVNTIAFVEDKGTKMITSSDDKKVLVWEWDIGVPIKYISDPTMHSMPAVTMHPSQRFFLFQSLDNRICVYQAGDRFALQRKKKFDGHNVAGYACEIGCSPDGRFICSGDSSGALFFWEFKRGKVLQKYRAHDKGPSIGCVWHPVEASTVFSCGWDGVIKMWQ